MPEDTLSPAFRQQLIDHQSPAGRSLQNRPRGADDASWFNGQTLPRKVLAELKT
jgi:hypothetical protein